MDIVVLGLLMMQKCTIYELRKLIENSFSLVSSNSMGSIQAAIKKLTDKHMVIFSESVENGVNRKVYEITEVGKTYFFAKVSSPMKYKEKNMELSKFFFMGFANKENRIDLIDAYIMELEKELAILDEVNTALAPRHVPSKNELAAMHNKGAANEITEDTVEGIAIFQYATLDLSIAKLQFEIKWFQDFKQKIVVEQGGKL
ncbi:MAG: PadR family transcriptional regulator [Suipraeoptans sp.]